MENSLHVVLTSRILHLSQKIKIKNPTQFLLEIFLYLLSGLASMQLTFEKKYHHI